jgi:hypothetical protein
VIIEMNLPGLTSGAIPLKDEPPLPVNPNGVPPRKISAQFLKMIAWRHTQV